MTGKTSRFKIFFILLIFAFIAQNINAQQTKFYAQSDAEEVFTNQSDAEEVFTNSYFNIKFVLENIEGNDFRPPDFSGLTVVNGPSTSTSISIVNGRKSQTLGKSYTLIASKPGQYTIGAATIKTKNGVLSTEPIKIKVRASAVKNNKTEGERFFVKQELSDSIAYPGQQIVLKYRLYTSENVSNYSLRSKPDYQGFIATDIKNTDRKKRIIIGDSEYTVHTLKTISLTPQQVGEFDFAPLSIVLQIPDPRSRNSFFRSTIPHSLTSNGLKLTVKELPENTSDNFFGHIGKYALHTRINKRQATTDDAVALTLQITCDGLAKFVNAPEIKNNFPDFQVYDPKLQSEKDYLSDGKVFSKKVFEYILVPNKKGRYNISIPYTYFDVDSAKYISKVSYVGNLMVTQGSKSLSAKSNDEQAEIEPLQKVKLSKKGTPFFGSVLYYVIMGLLFVSIIAMLFIRKSLDKKADIDPDVKRRLKSRKEALRRLKNAKMLMDKNEIVPFYKEISDALLKFVADKLNIPNIDLNKQNLEQKLNELKVSQSHITEYLELINDCEMSLYGGTASSEMNKVFNRTEKILTDLEVELN